MNTEQDGVGRLFAAADVLLLATRSSRDAHLLAPGNFNELVKRASPAASLFTRAELAAASAMLVRLGFAHPANAAA